MPLPPPPAGRFDHHGIAEVLGHGRRRRRGADGHIASGDHGDPGGPHGLTGLELVAHPANGLRPRADEDDPRRPACGREVGAFGQEPVPGVDGFCAAFFCRADDPVDRQVALPARRGADVIGLVGVSDMEGEPVGVRIDRGPRDPHLFAGPQDPDGDFTPVGYEYLLEHRSSSRRAVKSG